MGGEFGVRFLSDDEVICPIDDFVCTGLQEAADVWDLLEDEVAIAAVNFFETDVRIEHAQITAFADELFEQGYDRAFAKIVSIFFKGQTEDSETLAWKIERVLNGAGQVAFVAR